MKKGMKIPTRFGTLRLGDIIKVRLYENRGGEINTYTGEIIYDVSTVGFIIKDPDVGLTYAFRMAERPKMIKKFPWWKGLFSRRLIL